MTQARKKPIRKKTAGSGKSSQSTRSKSDTRRANKTGLRNDTGTIVGDPDKARRLKSKSMKKATLGLSMKFTIPVALVILMVIVLLSVFLARMTTRSISNQILKSGVAQVSSLATLGKSIIAKSSQVMTREEELVDDEKSPLETKEFEDLPWPIDLGLISSEEFYKLANPHKPSSAYNEKYDPQYYYQKTLYAAQKGGLLSDFIKYENKDGKEISTQVAAAYILCTDKKIIKEYYGDKSKKTGGSFILARSELGSEINDHNIGRLFIDNDTNWLPAYVNLNSYIADGKEISFESAKNPCSVYAGIVKGKNIKVLTFAMPIFMKRNSTVSQVGMAVIGLQAAEIVTEVDAINNLLIATSFVGVFLAVLTCFVIGWFVTRPVKTLISDMSIVAYGNLEHRTRAHSADEIGQIAVEFNEMTKHLLVASKKEKEAARLENELEMACEIQMKLLPARLPKIKGYDIHAVYHPAKEVGGDYYDLFLIDKRHVGIIVADVSGKGIPGSMVMATTRTILRFTAGGNLSSADTLAKTNAMVAADIKRGMFVTAFYLVLDVVSKKILCSSAGHNPMVVHHANGQIELINPNGIALGFDKGRIFSRTIKEQDLQLVSGDRVVMYTDGVVESMNEKNEEYSDERFYEFVRKHGDLSSEEFIEALLVDLDDHKGRAEQHDDITVVAFRVL